MRPLIFVIFLLSIAISDVASTNQPGGGEQRSSGQGFPAATGGKRLGVSGPRITPSQPSAAGLGGHPSGGQPSQPQPFAAAPDKMIHLS